jgi:amino acid transporter
MGRDGSLPSFFGSLHPRARVPRNNVLLIGGVSLVGAIWIDFSTGAELLNFGALTGFMGVNASALRRGWLERGSRSPGSILPPLAGFLICAYLWVHLSRIAWFAGGAWLLLGAAYLTCRDKSKALAAVR